MQIILGLNTTSPIVTPAHGITIKGLKEAIPELTRHYGIFVTNDMGKLTGIITCSDIYGRWLKLMKRLPLAILPGVI